MEWMYAEIIDKFWRKVPFPTVFFPLSSFSMLRYLPLDSHLCSNSEIKISKIQPIVAILADDSIIKIIGSKLTRYTRR